MLSNILAEVKSFCLNKVEINATFAHRKSGKKLNIVITQKQQANFSLSNLMSGWLTWFHSLSYIKSLFTLKFFKYL